MTAQPASQPTADGRTSVLSEEKTPQWDKPHPDVMVVGCRMRRLGQFEVS